MNIEDCPRFEKCNVPICPLDKHYAESMHLDGEAVCLYLREYSKPHARDNLKRVISQEHYKVIAKAYPSVLARYSHIRKVLKACEQRPSKLKSFKVKELR